MSWPSIMKNPSEDLKRILGSKNMDNRTLKRRLISLGFTGVEDFIFTDELIERVSETQIQKPRSFKRYQPRCPYAKEL